MDLAHEAFPVVISALPVLLPLLILGLLADPEVLSVVLWRGNVLALFLAIVPLLLPTIVAGVVLVIGLRYKLRSRPVARAAGACMAFLLLFVPLTFAAVQLMIVGVFVAAGTVGKGIRRAELIALAVSVTVSLVISVPAASIGRTTSGLVGTVSRAVIGRALAGIPEEVVTHVEADVSRMDRVRVVQVDDDYMTVIDNFPPVVRTIPNASITDRSACQSHREWIQQSAAELLGLRSSGTPECGPDSVTP